MRLSDADKLYKKLPPEQAATLAFEASVAQDFDEMGAITDNQPQFNFVGASNAYRSRAWGLYTLSLFYGAIYWKSRAVLMHCLSKYDEPGALRIAATLGSMELALVKACEQLGVSLESVKQLGDVSKEDYFGEYADEALTNQYIDLFLGSM
ncbi:MAG: hypothetical protein WCP96_11450 [Methylococcaceae bacterium]